MPGVVNPPTHPERRRSPRHVVRLPGYLAFALGLGAVAGVLWWWIVDLPGYRVNSDGGASTTERGLAGFIGGDAWFTLIGLVVGVVLGLVAWRRLGDLGWPVVFVATLAAVGASLICWAVGYHLGPGAFAPRLAAAQPGDVVPIELTVRAKAALLVWPFAATIPVLLGSSLGHDAEEPRPLNRASLLTEPIFGRPIFGRPIFKPRSRR